VEMGNDVLTRRTLHVVVDREQERHYPVSCSRILDDLLDVRILVLDDSFDGSFVGLVNTIGEGYHEDVEMVLGILIVEEYLDES
jgi:hypothetical protein